MELASATASSEPGSDSIVACRGLGRRFGIGETAVDALAEVDLDFPRGELTAIVGPSGSGKSTLMHLLAGLDRPTAGRAWVDGLEVGGLDDKGLTALRRSKLGFIFQFFNLVPVLSASENVALPLQIAGEEPDPDWLAELLGMVELTDRADHRPAELSGGQQQRVAIARALVSRPAVIFADEPTGNLDSSSSSVVLELLRRSVDSYRQTVVMVTHDPRVASYADRVVVLDDGTVYADREVSGEDEVIELMREL